VTYNQLWSEDGEVSNRITEAHIFQRFSARSAFTFHWALLSEPSEKPFLGARVISQRVDVFELVLAFWEHSGPRGKRHNRRIHPTRHRNIDFVGRAADFARSRGKKHTRAKLGLFA
jgi:hypothetical protein